MHTVSIGINIFETPQWLKCKENLLALKSRFSLYSLQSFNDRVDCTGFRRINCIKKTASDIIPLSKSKKPIVYEMMDALANSGKDYFVFMNNDIILSEEAIDWILNQNQYDSACFSRVDLEPKENRTFEKFPPYGFDVFVIKTSWWNKNRTEFLSIPNIYAEPCWDSAYATVLHSKSKCYFHNKIPLVYHLYHECRWSIETLEGSFTQGLFNRTKLISLWNEYLANTVISRKYKNGSIDKNDIENELAIERRIFGR